MRSVGQAPTLDGRSTGDGPREGMAMTKTSDPLEAV
jgi:hypothetical protein